MDCGLLILYMGGNNRGRVFTHQNYRFYCATVLIRKHCRMLTSEKQGKTSIVKVSTVSRFLLCCYCAICAENPYKNSISNKRTNNQISKCTKIHKRCFLLSFSKSHLRVVRHLASSLQIIAKPVGCNYRQARRSCLKINPRRSPIGVNNHFYCHCTKF